MPKSKLWKWFQNRIGMELKDLMKTRPIRPFPFYDTHAARNKYLPAQPGDFAVAVPGGCVLIEVKTSEEHASLANGLSSLMKKRQAAEHRLWHRTGNRSLITFYSSVFENVEFWEGEYVAPLRASGKSIDPTKACVFKIEELKDRLDVELR